MVEVNQERLTASARALFTEEAAIYAERHPKSRKAAQVQRDGFAGGVPLHWMRDWPMPFPLIIDKAAGCHLTDIDGQILVDFCLGDTGAMFGHTPTPITRALAQRATRGLTTMLPSADAEAVGTLLATLFGLPHWQVSTTASDANRFAIRVARAVTGRRKIVVFDGCYHGAVDDTLVDLVEGRTLPRRSLLGQVVDTGATTVAIPFNDEQALEAALAGHDIAVVLAEPVMTNCSMIQPEPGFLAALRRMTRQTDTLLLIDETHTLSSGLGGYARIHNVEPDILVMGKAIAGGVPASVWGFTRDVARRLAKARSPEDHGHSGIGTTLSGSALQLACLRANLEEVMTPSAYERMLTAASEIEAGLKAALEKTGIPWSVARVGARLEVVFRRTALRDAAEARATANATIENALHVALLNRGFLVTPFHNMVLVSPETTRQDATAFVRAYEQVLTRLAG